MRRFEEGPELVASGDSTMPAAVGVSQRSDA